MPAHGRRCRGTGTGVAALCGRDVLLLANRYRTGADGRGPEAIADPEADPQRRALTKRAGDYGGDAARRPDGDRVPWTAAAARQDDHGKHVARVAVAYDVRSARSHSARVHTPKVRCLPERFVLFCT
jgi:hypothetical protein